MNPIPGILSIDLFFLLHESCEFRGFNLNRLIGSVIEIHREMEEITFPEITWRRMFEMCPCQLGAERNKLISERPLDGSSEYQIEIRK